MAMLEFYRPRLWVLACAAALAACNSGRPPLPMLTPIVSGTLEVDAVAAPVRIVRDRWGVPHVYAESRDDVFAGQGFVQAQDRLFQMDLWRRSAQGRLAEVLGVNFIERDAMTRRLQYHGSGDAEWARYGNEAKPIAQAFVAGINAWVAIARAQPPELFRLAGWLPDEWSADDLLNRTDAFDRAGTIAVAERQGLPPAVVDSVRRAAVAPFFTGLASAVIVGSRPPRADPVGSFDTLPVPSRQYLIHLHTPQWNAIGATPPWRPGLTIGHDAAAAWERAEATYRAVVRVEPLNRSSGRVVKDAIPVKGRAEPFEYDTQVTDRGVVIATDREAGKQFALDWEGFKEGTAPAFAHRDRAAQTAASGDAQSSAESDAPVVFAHLLAITAAARDRLNIGPIPRPPDHGPPFRIAWDRNVWDASRAINAPGQAEWPQSVYYSDLAGVWSSGQMLTLAYTDAAVNANAQATLTLVPRRRR